MLLIMFYLCFILRNRNSFETTVHRKSFITIFIYTGNHFHLTQWKRDSIKTLVLRAHAICSTKELLDQEVNHLQHAFITFNGYRKWVVLQVLNKVEIDLSTASPTKNQQLDTHIYTSSPIHRNTR